jgi:hypothetical protein
MDQTMKISIHQPTFLPWIGTIHKILSADTHVFYSSAQFNKQGYQNRVKFKFSYITLPIQRQALDTPIKDIKVHDYSRHMSNILKTIEQSERRTKYFDRITNILSFVENSLNWRNWNNEVYLTDVTIPLTELICKSVTDKVPKFVDFTTELTGHPSDKLQIIIDQFLGTMYVTGGGASTDYLKEVPIEVPVMIQHKTRDVYEGSILHLICTSDNPYDEIMSAFSLVEFDIYA